MLAVVTIVESSVVVVGLLDLDVDDDPRDVLVSVAVVDEASVVTGGEGLSS